MPALQKSDAVQPQGINLRDAQQHIEKLMNANADVNPKGTRSRMTDPDARDAKGRFRPPQPEGDTADADVEDAVADDTATTREEPDETETVEETAAAPGDDTDAATADEAADASAETSEPIQTLAELADGLGIPLAELKAQLKHSFKAAGEDHTVTLAELEAGYQKDADYRRSTAKLSEERRAFENEMRQRQDAYVANAHALAQQLTIAEQQVQAKANSPQLAELRTKDPAMWSAAMIQLNAEHQQLLQARSQAAAQYQNYQATQLSEAKARESKALLDAVPDWGEEKRMTSVKTMASLGYTEPEISQVLDSRLIRGALELAELRAYKAAAEAEKATAADAVKRVKKDIPKLSKPTKQTLKGPAGIKRDNMQRLRSRLNKSKSVRDAAPLIEQFL